MRFFCFGRPDSPAPSPPAAGPGEIPDEDVLVQAMLTAFRDPAITSTAALHAEVAARHPGWTIPLKRVRRLLCRVAALHQQEQEARVACGEDGAEDWCVVSGPPVAQAAPASVSAVWTARRESASPASENGTENQQPALV
jgi:hypothetical protein